jgi:hypothetical protein
MMGGSGKRSLPMAHGTRTNTIGKLRRLRLPLPPLFCLGYRKEPMMNVPRDNWSDGQADEWTIHDLLAAVLGILSYALTLIGTAGALLLRTWGFVALAAGVASVILMYRVIDPKLRAMSKAFAERQDEFLKHVDRTTRWEQ